MNKEYIKELFEKNKKTLKESEYEIKSPEDLEELMKSIIISNMEYDFHIYPDANKLFNKQKENNREIVNDDVDIEK